MAMPAEQESFYDKSVISESCDEISACEENHLKNIASAIDEADHFYQNHKLKAEKPLCNCTQTGEVKILVKKITDLENEQQKAPKIKNNISLMEYNTSFIKSDITTDTNDNQKQLNNEFIKMEYKLNEKITDDETNQLTSSINDDKCESKHRNNHRHFINDRNNICERQIAKDPNITQQNTLKDNSNLAISGDNHQEVTCTYHSDRPIRQNTEEISNFLVKARENLSCSKIVGKSADNQERKDSSICSILKENAEEMAGFLVKTRENVFKSICSKRIDDEEVIRQSDGNDSSICPISKENIDEMSGFLVKAREKRHMRRLSTVQEPVQVVPSSDEYQIDEMSDPFASILEQGDHIMDTFHNLLTDNGNLTVRISFSYCAKLLAVLLTLNTVFFSKIILWDSFLRHLF